MQRDHGFHEIKIQRESFILEVQYFEEFMLHPDQLRLPEMIESRQWGLFFFSGKIFSPHEILTVRER